jgi:HEAT repeat protein
VRSNGAKAFKGEIGSRDTPAALVRAMAGGDVPRAVAGPALIAIGPAAAPEVRPLLHAEDTKVRRTAAEVLGLVGAAPDAAALAEAVHDPAAAVRAAALRALGRIGGRGESEVARAALQDLDPFVRTCAARAVAQIGDRRVVSDLIAQARADSYNPASAAARALVAIDPGALRTAAAQRGAGPHLRQAAAAYLFGR